VGLTDRRAESEGGPRGGTCWFDTGDSFTLQNHATITANTTLNQLCAQTVTRPNLAFLKGSQLVTINDDALDATNVIQTLYGFQITMGAALAASAALTLSMSVYRVVGALATAITGGVAITSATLAAPGLAQPLPSGSVLTLTNAAGNTQAVTLSAAAAFAQQILAINSVTPANSYAVGNMAVWQVGNQAAFGWLNSGAGTPTFPAFASALGPPLTGNTSLITTGGSAAGTVGNAALPVQAGDSLIVNLVTSAGTVIVPISNLQPLLT
jgi:hypothetical protein